MSVDDPVGVVAKAVELGLDPWSAAGRQAAYRALGLEAFAPDPEERALASFTPTWTAATTAPALGAGVLLGRQLRDGKLGDLEIKLTAAANTTYGTGAWRFALPSGWVPKRDGNLQCCGFDGTNRLMGVAEFAAQGTYVVPYLPTLLVPPLAIVDVDSPFTWANTMWLRIWGTMELE